MFLCMYACMPHVCMFVCLYVCMHGCHPSSSSRFAADARRAGVLRSGRDGVSAYGLIRICLVIFAIDR